MDRYRINFGCWYKEDKSIWPYMIERKGWFFWSDTGIRYRFFDDAKKAIDELNSLET